jgi:hypothetical protein
MDLCPRVTLAGSTSSLSVRYRFHTCRPVYRGFSRIVVTAPSVLYRFRTRLMAVTCCLAG